jgi:hypothetical protein
VQRARALFVSPSPPPPSCLAVHLREEVAHVGFSLDHVRAQLVEHDARAELGGVGRHLAVAVQVACETRFSLDSFKG